MNATVKRKFNALLQGIGNRPPSSSSNTAALDTTASATPVDGMLESSLASSSTSPSRMASHDALEFLSKKRRIGAGPGSTSPFAKYDGQAAGASIGAITGAGLPGRGATTTISNITLRKWMPASAGSGSSPVSAGAAASPGGKDKAAPLKYCPGDREQLLRRLATFQELTDWTPKPDRVNEVEWAKRGWACQGKERVQCTLCSRDLVVKLNRKEVDGKQIPVLIASEIAESVVDKYAELIVEAHEEDCLWRRKGCDDSLLRIPLPNAKVALKDLRLRYDELCARKAFLPYEFNLRLPKDLDVDTILSYLPPHFFTEPPPPDGNTPLDSPPTAADSNSSPTTPTLTLPRAPINRAAVALAVLGWQGLSNPRIGPVPNSASCHTCLRRLGMWMFKSKEVEPETQQILVPAPMDHLDPLREHRFFCPWKTGGAQRNPGAKPLGPGEEDKAAWEVLVQMLRNEAFIRQRTSVAHSRSKSSVPPQTTPIIPRSTASAIAAAMKTPERRPTTADGRRRPGQTIHTPQGAAATPGAELHEDDEDGEDDDDEESRKKKDQAMMSRLRRVKSLFNTKAGKLKRLGGGSSRPGTSHSTVGGGG
ncbi:C3HC zinc finger-like-domain-containing protein [Lasiosphaeria miniovina]|uniref:C3HC zinc finger-like-domain-containing protein n=1 Tax=Lasiosphaeria miniovina TaxID=1954250 RepID=A0AA40EFE3_9PEZI|nr:C3HC zinc finger-like-domain-containing protein [Lasiosphaeria miniovina]KAK0733263.1 C3HC zinc finger-like-domain-containing protein [Lasiosphaeria miniovina]